MIVGPPGSGKSTVARQLSDMFRLHHFTPKEMIESTRDLLVSAVIYKNISK